MKNLYEILSFLKTRMNKPTLNQLMGYFDTESYIINLNTSFEEKEVLYDLLTIKHEKNHWIQFASSTLGMLYTLIHEFETNLIWNLMLRHDYKYPLINYINKDDEYIYSLYNIAEMILCYLEGSSNIENINRMKKSNLGKMFNLLLDSIVSEALVHNNVFREANLINTFHDMLKKSNDFKLNLDNRFVLFQNNKVFGTIDLLEGAARIQDKISLYNRFEYPDKYIDLLCNDSVYENAEIIFDKLLYPITFNNYYVFKKFFILLLIDYAINFISPMDISNAKFYADYLIFTYSNIIPFNRYVRLIIAFKELITNDEVEMTCLYNEENDEIKYNVELLNEFIENIYLKLEKKTDFDNPIKTSKRFLDDKNINDANSKYLNLYLFNFKKLCKIRIECPLFLVSSEMLNYYDRGLYLKYYNELNILFKFNGNFPIIDNENETYIINSIIYSFLVEMFFSDNISLEYLAKKNSVESNYIKHVLESFIGKDKIENILKFQ